MSQRKDLMLQMGDAFIALPGGAGTLEEIAEAISAARLGRHAKPCMLYNIHGCYDHLEKLFDHMVKAGFLNQAGVKRQISLRLLKASKKSSAAKGRAWLPTGSAGRRTAS